MKTSNFTLFRGARFTGLFAFAILLSAMLFAQPPGGQSAGSGVDEGNKQQDRENECLRPLHHAPATAVHD